MKFIQIHNAETDEPISIQPEHIVTFRPSSKKFAESSGTTIVFVTGGCVRTAEDYESIKYKIKNLGEG